MSAKSFVARLRYEFDKTMAAGPAALIGWLALVSLAVIALAALILIATGISPEGEAPLDFLEAFWESLMRTLDAGTMGGDAGWGFRIVMLGVTIAGIFIVSTLIGILSSGLEGKLDELRKGRSQVIEEDHTIIFNWSASIFDILSELAIANESRRRPRIVILADMDKVEMEEAIAAKGLKLRNTRVICRRGDPTDLSDLQIASPQTSRSIIVLSPPADDPDPMVIKTIVALVNDPRRRQEPYRIAAEIRDGHNMDVARAVGGKEAQLILADDVIARIMAHSCRQSGLSGVYTELLDFDGSEIYAAEQPGLTGKKFAQAIMSYDSCTLIGVVDKNGKVMVNPPMRRVFAPGDKALLIAEDDSEIRLATDMAKIARRLIRKPSRARPVRERTLMLGWNRRGPLIASELSRHVAKGSLLTIAADAPELASEASGLAIAAGMKIEIVNCDTTSHAALQKLRVESYDHVLVLGASDRLSAQTADTHTLITLLHLRKLADAAGRHINVVSEMIDVRNRELAEVARADDFVVSNKLVSLMLAQASENAYLAEIFGDLLDADGSEIRMRAAREYVAKGKSVNFHTVAQAALERGEVALGHFIGGKVVVNPPRGASYSYGADDRIVVLSRE